MDLNLIHSFFLVITILIIIIQLLMISSLLKYKNYKNKEEYLILTNQICTLIILFIFSVYIVIWYIIKINEIVFKITNYIFNVYIIFLYITNYMIVLEYYYTYTYPIHFFSYLLKMDVNIKNYHNLFFLSLLILTIIFDLLYCEIDFIKDFFINNEYIHLNSSFLFQCNNFGELGSNVQDNNKNLFPFVLTNKYKGFILMAICLLTLIHIIFLLCKIGKFYFKNYNLLKKKLKIKLFIIILYLFYAITSIFEGSELSDLINSFLILIILFVDNLVLLIKYSESKFVQVRLNKTFIGVMGGYINKCLNKKEKILPLTYSIENLENISSSLIEGSSKSFNISLNAFEHELLLMYQNDIFFEDYYLSFFDQFLNIITSSLYKLYNSKVFSTKEVNNKKLSKQMNITVSSISGGGISGINSSRINEEIIMPEDLSTFTFYKNHNINDYTLFQDILDNSNIIYNRDLKVTINLYYFNSCMNNIIDKNYSSNYIAKSLISHMLIKSRNPSSSTSSPYQEMPNYNYSSLTVENAKELYFKNLKNICFKTFDKKLTLEMFETNEELNNLRLNSLNKKDNNISELINKYFIYVETKGINNTFLPLILGIFKIKINHFKPLLIILTDNSIVENVPIKNFTNWQLIRFKEKGLIKVGSSRYNKNSIIEDDIIFKRVNYKEKKFNKECQIKLINYEEVKNILLSDINFLKKGGCYKFNLLLMYYEYDNNQTKESCKENEVIKIKKSKNNSPQIVNEILPKGYLFENSKISSDSDTDTLKHSTVYLGGNNSSHNSNKKNDKTKNDNEIQIITDKVLDDNYNVNNREINQNIIKFSEQININGYDGIFDNYNCLCFFTFENIFENQIDYQYNYDFYKNYMYKIMKYFTSLKKKENKDKDNIELIK